MAEAAARPRRRLALGALVALYTGGLLLLAIGVTTLVVSWRFSEVREVNVVAFLALKAEQLSAELASAVGNRLRVLRAHASRTDLRDLASGRAAPSARIRTSFDELQAAWPDFSWIGVADRSGRVLAATRDLYVGNDVSQREWFRQGLGGPFMTVPRTGTGEKLIELAYPVVDESGKVIGVLGAELPRAWVESLRNRIGLTSGEALRFTLVIAHADGLPLGTPPRAGAAAPANDARRWSVVFGADAADEELPYFATAPMRGDPAVTALNWYSIAYTPRRVLADEVVRIQREALVAGVAVAALFLPLSLLIARLLARPLALLTRSLESRRAGQNVDIPLAGTAETAALATAIRAVLADLDAERSALRSSERRLDALIDSAPDAIVSVNVNGRVRLFNRAAEAMFGLSARQMMGEPLNRLLPVDRQSQHVQHLLDYAAGPDHARAMGGNARKIVGVRADGREFPIEASIFKTRFDRETVLTAILRDVTQAREMSAALARSEEHYRELFERHPVAMWVFDTQTLRFLAVNEAAVLKYGWSREEFLKMNLLEVRPPEEAQRTLESVRQPVTREFTVSGIWTHQLRSGERVKIEASGRALTWEGRPARMAVLYDVTQRERALAEISRRREQLVELSRELMDKEAAERRRLSQLLHDRFAQNLAAAKLALETARLRGVAPELLQPALGVLEDALQEVRGLLHDLRPPLLDDFGLRAALAFEIERRQIADGAQIRFAPVPDGTVEPRLDGTVEYGMFGIAREALANALFHAQASHIDVALDLHADRAQLVVRDDGIGFTAADEERARHHLGLVSMRERAGWIGATLAIESASGQGTVVKLDWQAAKGVS